MIYWMESFYIETWLSEKSFFFHKENILAFKTINLPTIMRRISFYLQVTLEIQSLCAQDNIWLSTQADLKVFQVKLKQTFFNCLN